MLRFEFFLMLVVTTAMSLAGCGGGSTSKLEQQVAELEQQLKDSEAARKAVLQTNPFKEMRKMENDVARLAEVEQAVSALREENQYLNGQVAAAERELETLTAERVGDNGAAELSALKTQLSAAQQEIARLKGAASARPGSLGTSASGAEIVSTKRFDAFKSDYVGKGVKFLSVTRLGAFQNIYKDNLPGVKIGSSAEGFITTVNLREFDKWLEFTIWGGEGPFILCFALKDTFGDLLVELDTNRPFNVEGYVVRINAGQVGVLVSRIEPVK